MTAFDAPCPRAGADVGLDHEPGGHTPLSARSPRRHGSDLPHWLMLKRGEERLILFRGWPEPGLLQTFQRMAITVGLALDGRDALGHEGIGACRYLYIGQGHRRGGAFAYALRDLAGLGWSVDGDAVWPVIAGGYQPKALDDAPLPMRETPLDQRPAPAAERMEA